MHPESTPSSILTADQALQEANALFQAGNAAAAEALYRAILEADGRVEACWLDCIEVMIRCDRLLDARTTLASGRYQGLAGEAVDAPFPKGTVSPW
ncbi:MAG: hypothetical protein HQL96_01370 [Magnetococcales bacterium]|nr:hypothetical protein [Magnetococcales bacterium]